MNPQTSKIERFIPLQYNPDSLTRSFQVRSVGGEGSNQSDVLRLTGPPVETYKIEAEVDGTDQLEFAKSGDPIIESGIQPILAALEVLIYPATASLKNNDSLAKMGILEIVPVESLLTLFIWSKQRIVPVRITELNITEEAFDVHLNPIRAKVSLGMRVLSVDDLGFSHLGGSVYLNYQQNKEKWAKQFRSGSLTDFGINSIL